MSDLTHAVWTRYVSPKGNVIRHAFGPYTKSQALAQRRVMLREAREQGHGDRVEIAAVKLISGLDETIDP